MRKAFLDCLIELAKEDERIFLVSADIGYSVIERFVETFPKRFLNVGIAEQNAVGVSAGLSMSGFIPYYYNINPFAVMRPFEQIRLDVAYMENNVRIVGIGSGLSYGSAGATHHSIEDIAIMRVLPNMTVICPGDPLEVTRLVRQSVEYKGPIFLRLGKQGEPNINLIDTEFKIGEANIIKNGSDLVLISTGNALALTDDVGKELYSLGIEAGIVSMHTVKPLDVNCIMEILKSGKPIFTIEEHNIIGGLGSALSEVISESSYSPIFKRFGVEDIFSHYVGSQSYLRKKLGLTKQIITKKIIEMIGKKI